MTRLMIDTNIYSRSMRGDMDVVSVLKTAEEIGISIVSIGIAAGTFQHGLKLFTKDKHFLQVPGLPLV